MLSSLSIDLYRVISDGDKQRPMERWHASSIAQCPRGQYLARSGVERLTKPTGAKVLRWQAGHNIEAAIEEPLTKLYKDLDHNKRFESETLDLTGEYDFYDADTKRIVEIKSVHDMAFIEKDGRLGLKETDGVWETGRWAGKNKWKLKQSPYLHHEMQEFCYYLLMKEHGIEVKGVDYVYISLSGRLVTYSTEIDPQGEVAASVLGRLRLLNELWKSQTPPPCYCNDEESPLYNSVYKWCDYKEEDKCCDISKVSN